MEKLFLSLNTKALIAIVALIASVSWLSLCQKYYDSYWNGTIHRVQTVDFNILHHTMPVTLSYLILSGRADSIQETLDSNYGIFGMIITDPKGENIVYKSEKVYKAKSWQKELSIKTVKESQAGGDVEHFDWLTNPPPDHAQYANESPRVSPDKQVAAAPQGQVIGRVYYIRQPPPPFSTDLAGAFMGNWFEMSGSKRGYVLQTLNVISFSLLIVLVVLWRKQVIAGKEHELHLLEKELAIKRRNLDTLTSDLNGQRKRKEWLEQESQRAYNRALRLKESLQKLKEAFFFVEGKPGAAAAAQLNQLDNSISVRPPQSPPSAVIEEIESLLPDLTNNAKILRSQAEVLQSYCTQLEMRQTEMQQILEHKTPGRTAGVAPAGPHLRAPFNSEQPAP
ncbi:MAG TPA: hypothetical protein V6D22_05685 [Candidatus Obscuribacterales bacterium]